MSTTHLYTLNGGTDWTTQAVKAKGLWVWDGTQWRVAQNQYIWDGNAWRRGYTTTPGPLDHVTVAPSSASVPSGTSYVFTAQGWDADNLSVSLSGHTISWSVNTISDTIDADGTFHANAFGSANPPYNCIVTVTVDSSFSGTSSVTVT